MIDARRAAIKKAANMSTRPKFVVGRTVARRGNKYHAKRVVLDGILFASQAESVRYVQLKALEAVGDLHSIDVHPVYELWVRATKVGCYTPDFRYIRRGDATWTIEEVKGKATEAYRLRVKVFRALYPDLTFIELAAKTLIPVKRKTRRRHPR